METAYYTVRIMDDLFSRFLRLVCILMMFIGAYAIYDSYNLFYHAQDKSILKYKPQLDETGAAVGAIEIKNAAGWLTLDHTSIDYPIMQGENNSEYLNKDPLGAFSLSGSIYMDYRNTSDFSDNYTLVYGHHMEHEMMFGALDLYKERNFFDAHRYGTLIHNNRSETIRVFAVMDCLATDEIIFSTEYDGDYVSYIRQNANIFEEPLGGRILALTTCSETVSEKRLAVFAEILEGR